MPKANSRLRAVETISDIRHLISGLVLSSLLLAVCFSASAQQTAQIPRIGILRTGSPPDPLIEAFVQGPPGAQLHRRNNYRSRIPMGRRQ